MADIRRISDFEDYSEFLLAVAREVRTAEFPSIVSDPDICGGAARMIRTRIPVWTLERMRQLGVPDAEILRNYPTLRAADLVQAWAYAAARPEEIGLSIRENEAL